MSALLTDSFDFVDPYHVVLSGPNGNSTVAISTLCGDNPPTFTGGGAKWQTIDRPLARGVTVFQGYDPVTMRLDLRFGSWNSAYGWDQSDDAALAVEQDIDQIEAWFGTKITTGPPDAILIQGFDKDGNASYLIPYRYWGYLWIVTDLQYGQSYRNSNGRRIRQDATLTLTNFINPNGGSNTASQDEVKKTHGGYFISKPGRDTALLIAQSPSSNRPIRMSAALQQDLAKRILSVAKNNPMKGSRTFLEHKSIYWHIPHGKAVWVPPHDP